MALVAALALAGCGEEDSTTTTGATTTTAGDTTGQSGELSPKAQKLLERAHQKAKQQQEDNSIQTFGVEAPSGDRVEAAGVFQAYLDARRAGRWADACAYLAGPTRTQLEQFGKQAQGSRPLDCAEVMRGFTEGVPREALRNAAEIRVLSMRVEGEQAFLLYRDGEGTPSSAPMNQEGGSWKVAAIAGSALVEPPGYRARLSQ